MPLLDRKKVILYNFECIFSIYECLRGVSCNTVDIFHFVMCEHYRIRAHFCPPQKLESGPMEIKNPKAKLGRGRILGQWNQGTAKGKDRSEEARRLTPKVFQGLKAHEHLDHRHHDHAVDHTDFESVGD